MMEALIVCGPTACGKTDFAHNLATKYQGEIINADSMQIYSQIPILTAQPSERLQNELPYHLYGFVDVGEEFSVVKYARMASKVIKEIASRNKLPIIVGGSGMYINALVEGYNEIPNISAKIRRESRDLYIKVGPEDFFNHLKSLDPAAVRLNNNDQQRMLRAYEVVVQTGQSIFSFRNQNKTKLLSEFNFKSYFLYPERNFLYASCDQRLRKIFASGAITEVQNLYNMPIGSAKKALGFREIADYLDNKITLDEAINNAQNKTRRYAKRQITWFKNQLKEKIIFKYSNLEEFYALNVN